MELPISKIILLNLDWLARNGRLDYKRNKASIKSIILQLVASPESCGEMIIKREHQNPYQQSRLLKHLRKSCKDEPL